MRPARGTFWGIGVAGGALFAVNALGPHDTWVGLAEDAASALALIGLWVGARRASRARGPGTRAWLLLSLAVTCWVFGDFVWDSYALAGVTRPDVSVADVWYLAGYPVLAVGLFEMGRARAGRRAHEGLLDGCVFAAAATMAVWQVLVVPATHITNSWFTSIVWGAYPLADVLVLAAAVWVALTPGRRTRPTYLLLAAVTTTFVVDSLYAYLPTISGFDPARLDPLYPISYALIAAAALHPGRDELTTHGTSSAMHMHPARFGLLAVSLCTAPVVGILAGDRTWTERLVMIGLSLAVSAAVIARFVVAVRSRERAQQALAHRATHDELTGVVNRVLLIDRIEHALARARRNQESLTVLYLDLDRFKPVNDTLGHQTGDELLVEAARRISEVVRASDTVGRIGSDEFVVLCENATLEASVGVAEQLVAAISAPVDMADLSLRVTASIGIAISTHGTGTAGALIGNADGAMNAAKRAGGDRYELYDETLRDGLIRRRQTEGALRHALARDELVLHYQPIVDLHDETVTAFEALLRWQRDEDTLVAPDDFIPIAEEAGLIVEIGGWVIDSVCAQLASWTLDGIDGPSISVNVSALQLDNGALQHAVERALARTGANPTRLILEVTESILVQDGDAITQLRHLRQRGVRVAIDDFGTGYSSLAYLRHLPVDILKVDRAFVAELVAEATAATVLAAIIHLAHTLGFLVVAEGAETHAQVELLRHLGCDEIQGFFYARPAPITKLDANTLRGSPMPRLAPGSAAAAASAAGR